MDSTRFDDLTKTLAAATTRRRFFKLLGGGLVGGALAAAGLRSSQAAEGGNSACVAICEELFPPGDARGQCVSEGARGEGPCAGPAPQICQGTCVPPDPNDPEAVDPCSAIGIGCVCYPTTYNGDDPVFECIFPV